VPVATADPHIQAAGAATANVSPGYLRGQCGCEGSRVTQVARRATTGVSYPVAGGWPGWRCAYSRTVPDVVDIAPARFAPLIAPVIERLTLAVVTKAMTRGASTTAPRAAPPGAMRMFGQLRTALLARKVPTAGLAAIYRYRDAGDVRRDLEGSARSGIDRYNR
jgi:hypothetical protein